MPPFRPSRSGARQALHFLLFRVLWLCVWWLGATGIATAELGAGPVPFQDGPIEERNQFLLNILFLGFHARGGDLLPAGEQRLWLSQVFSNTYVGSDAFFGLAQDDPSGERQELSSTMLSNARRSEPDEILYFVDSEMGRTELRYRAGLGSKFELGVEVPFLSYRGGTFDGTIETYHNNLNLGNGGREFFLRDAVQVTVSTPDNAFLVTESPSRFEMGDLTLFGRFGVVQAPRGSFALTLALKLPTGDEDLLAGSGSADAGVELEGTRRWGANRLHLSGGWVRVGKWKLLPDYDPVSLGNILVGYEFLWREKISWVAQFQAQTTVFRGRAGNRLDDPTVELVAGLRWRQARKWFWEAAFIENIFNQDTGVDFGLRLGVGLRWPGS